MPTLAKLRAALFVKHHQFAWLLLRYLHRTGLPDRFFLAMSGWVWLFFGITDETIRDFTAYARRFALPMGFSNWCRFRILRGVANGAVLRFRTWHANDKRLQIAVDGQELMVAAQAVKRGVLVLTYHHHFNALFCALLGRTFGQVHVFAQDPQASPLYQPLRNIAEQLYGGSELFFNGGKYLYVSAAKPFMLRQAVLAFRSNAMLVSVHDFPAPGLNKISGLFLNHEIAYPAGAVEYALHHGTPILFGYLAWRGGDRFVLCLRPCPDTKDAHSVLRAYFQVLEHEFFPAPERWEYWKTL